jgi:putative transposase
MHFSPVARWLSGARLAALGLEDFLARLPRLVLPGHPYHVTQRGNRHQRTFFEDDDHERCRDLMAEAELRCGITVTVY